MQKKQRLEDCLGDFILNLGIVAKALKLDREECQRREREREEERRREEEQRVQREEYLRKVEVMKAFNKEWEPSLSLARFAQAFVAALEAPEVPEQTKTALGPIAGMGRAIRRRGKPLHAFGKNGTALSRSQEIVRILATLQAQKNLEWNRRFENLSSVHQRSDQLRSTSTVPKLCQNPTPSQI